MYIPFYEVGNVILGKSENEVYSIILLQSRIPKAITAVLVGIALPVAGLIMQTFFRNPLAGPDVLGISSGSSLMVAIVIMGSGLFGLTNGMPGNAAIITAAVAGSIFILVVVFLVANKMRDAVSLLIFGLMLGTVVSAMVSIFQYTSENQALKNYTLWTLGNISSVTWQQLYILIPLIIIFFGLSFLCSKYLNGLLLGDDYAKTIGIPLRKVRLILIFITAVLTGGITAFCGPIVFVGVSVPHFARIIFKTTGHLILIPACAFTGIALMLLCDIITQAPPNFIIPVNSVTSLMGAPFIIFMIVKNHALRRYF